MLIEIPTVAVKTISARTDEEMYYATKALAQTVGADPSTVVRLALSALLRRARERQPVSWDDLKNVA
jgi:antitoxin component of RelBE/YafQ-DinJ toxin-antitoxin module